MSRLSAKLRRVSFRTRLSTLTALAVGVTVALAAMASYFTVRHELLSQVDSSLVGEAHSAFTSLGCGQEEECINLHSLDQYVTHNKGLVQVITAQRTLDQNFSVPGDTTELPISAAQAAMASSTTASGGISYRTDTVTSGGVTYRVLTEGGIIDPSTNAPIAIQIAVPLNQIDHTLSDLGLILWLVALAGIVVAIGMGYLIGKAMLRPVERLTAAAEHVALTQQLEATIQEEGDDELTRLAHSFNSMLGALAESRQQQAQLISDAGHELRTPLTSLRTNVEVLMKVRNLPEADRSALMTDVGAQIEELTTLIGDLVDLAREDEKQTDPIEVRFDSIVVQAVERARRRAPGVTFDTHITAGSVRAQPALLERAVLNVLDNAAKWSPPDGVVSVWLQRGACWTLDIRDQGPGIPAEDLPHVFDRFYRAETSRSMPGSGLGLAIVSQVVTAIGGTVSASSPPEGGTHIHMELPIVAEQEPGLPDGARDDNRIGDGNGNGDGAPITLERSAGLAGDNNSAGDFTPVGDNNSVGDITPVGDNSPTEISDPSSVANSGPEPARPRG